MTRTWMEDIVKELYELKGYCCTTSVMLGNSSTGGRGEADVVAVKSEGGLVKEICHIECGTHSTEDLINKKFTERNEEIIKKRFGAGSQTGYAKLVVWGELTEKRKEEYKQALDPHRIRMVGLDEFFLDTLAEVKKWTKGGDKAAFRTLPDDLTILQSYEWFMHIFFRSEEGFQRLRSLVGGFGKGSNNA